MDQPKDDILEDVTGLIFPETEATEEQKKLINRIIKQTTNELKARIHDKEIPKHMEYIITGVSVIRFNRIGSEGMHSETVEGHSMSWNSDDFAAYQSVIDDYLDENGKVKRIRGKVRFL